jgi:hypothetical protein
MKAHPRKETKMKSYWLRCKVSPGQFSGEVVVEGTDFRGRGFSLFAPDNVIECDAGLCHEESVEGWILIDVIDRKDDLVLVRLPRAPLENGPTVTVREGQLEYRTAREPAV